MGFSVNQNIAATNSYRNLSITQDQQAKSLEKLSSGLRINRAADDAAGLAISEGLRSQVGGLTQAARNAQDGISVVQTAEGALTEVHAILQRMRDLAVQGANDSNNADARANIKTESDQLVAELGRIASSTNFNGTNLLDGSAGGGTGKLSFQVGADGNSASRIDVDLSSANVSNIAKNLEDGVKQQIVTFDGTAPFAGLTAASTIAVGGTNVTIGAATSVDQIAASINANATVSEKYTASVSDGKLVVAAKDSATATPALAFGTGPTAAPTIGAVSTVSAGYDSHANAQATINLVDDQIKSISTARANLGAYQNRFEHTIKNVNVAIENLSASESRIRDTDMANEMVKFTRSQILSQAGTAMLAQANQIPQGILSLLR